MKKLRRFNPPDLWRGLKIEFRENKSGIRIYEFNYRTFKYDKYLGLIYRGRLNQFIFEPNYKNFHFNTSPLYEEDINIFNKKLNHFWGEHAYLTEEAVEYLMSVNVMNKLLE